MSRARHALVLRRQAAIWLMELFWKAERLARLEGGDGWRQAEALINATTAPNGPG
jgi:hypothetical protein